MYRISELSVGPFPLSQPNPTHQLSDPTQPIVKEKLGPTTTQPTAQYKVSRTITTRHRASTSMYSLTFRVRVATPAQYGRNGTASLQIKSHTQEACVRSACGVRALGLADYRWALPRISIMLP